MFSEYTQPARQALIRHASDTAATDTADAHRPSSLQCGALFADFGRSGIGAETLPLLLDYAKESQVEARVAELFAGEAVNGSEKRGALHWLHRTPEEAVPVNLRAEGAAARASGARALDFAQAVRAGKRTAADGTRFRRVVHLGAGGSMLGPRLVCDALRERAPADGLETRFVSGVDALELERAFAGIPPDATLFVVASKGFATPETLRNARSARRLVATRLRVAEDDANVLSRFAAATANPEGAREWGIAEENVFEFTPQVGGRFSLWSPVGLLVCGLALGADNMHALARGGHLVDQHFRDTPLGDNMPVRRALTALWHGAFCGHGARALLTYDHRLAFFPEWAQGLELECWGKAAAAEGTGDAPLSVPALWGGEGTAAEHSLFQFLHQSPRTASVEFFAATALPPRAPALGDAPKHHDLLLAHCLGQAQALEQGRAAPEEDGTARHRLFVGNRPSSMLLYDDLTPETLGQLLVLVESRAIALAFMLGVNPFDQWGVELGKEIAQDLEPALSRASDTMPESADTATRSLLLHIREARARVEPES